MIKNTAALVLNDLAIAFKNRSVYLILFIPLFAVLSLKLVDPPNEVFHSMRIGIMRNETYPSLIIKSLRSADKLFTVTLVGSEAEGKKNLQEGKLDGILTKAKKGVTTLELVVLRKGSFQTLAIVSGLTTLQMSAEGKSANWIAGIKPLRAGGLQKQTLPTWVLMSVLLVGLIIMPAQVAEEKENKLLLGLLQTPMREIEWVLAKLLVGMLLSFMAVLLLHLLGGFDFGEALSYFLFLGAGALCFCSFGILLGFLCANQASARTLGVLFYLPLMFPAALADFSQRLSAAAPFLLSYQFYGPIRSILLEGGKLSSFPLEWIYLFLVGAFACLLSIRLMKMRWLM
ncbi:MAG: ABC transporter permease [Candidatus Margulisiibacteriota bacterium]